MPGLGKAAFAYLPLLFDRDSVKLDTHVWRFVDRTIGGQASSEEQVRDVFAGAAELLSERTRRPCTMRGLEHFVWRTESGRKPL